MRYRQELLLLVLLVGVSVLFYHERFPLWFFYVVMLGSLVASHQLAPQWSAAGWERVLWWACMGIALVGLALEGLSRLG